MFRAAKNLSFLSLSTLMGAACQLLGQSLLARRLGTQEYGTFAAALALVTIVSPLAGFGAPRAVQMLYGEEGSAAARWVPGVRRYLYSSTAAALLLLVACAVLQGRRGFVLFVLLPCVPSFAMMEMVSARCQLEGRYGRVSAWQVFQPIGRLVAALLMVLIADRSSVSPFRTFSERFCFLCRSSPWDCSSI